MNRRFDSLRSLIAAVVVMVAAVSPYALAAEPTSNGSREDTFGPFSEAATIASWSEEQRRRDWTYRVLLPGSSGLWYLYDASRCLRSMTHGRTWSDCRTIPNGDDDSAYLAQLAADDQGNIVAVSIGGRYNELYVVTSADHGETWTVPRLLARLPDVLGDCAENATRSVRIARSPNDGRWLITWHYADMIRDAPGIAGLFFVSSDDDGRTWSEWRQIAQGENLGANDSRLVWSPGSGWVLAATDDRWIYDAERDDWTYENDIVVVTSSDGESWTEPMSLFSGLDVVRSGYSGFDMAAARTGEVILTFIRPLRGGTHEFADEGEPKRVMVVRSIDGGRTWGRARTIARHSERFSIAWGRPGITCSNTGHCLVAWTRGGRTQRNGKSYYVSKALAVASLDGGQHWSGKSRLHERSAVRNVSTFLPIVEVDSRGRWVATWVASDPAWIEPRQRHLLLARIGSECGNGVVEEGEACDDGNQSDADECRSNCLIAGCGDGIVDPGEACDEGDRFPGYGCSSSCELPRCGDGEIWLDIEECDDGNESDGDGCLAGCIPATCGDGYVHRGVEECDDGNFDMHDACTNACTIAVCGDGIVREGFEQCDEGLGGHQITCTRQCTFGICGDGIRQRRESCEILLDDPSTCSPWCDRMELCGDVDEFPGIAGPNPQRILSYVTGGEPRCTPEACDLDGDDQITLKDVARAVRIGEGSAVSANCAAGYPLEIMVQNEAQGLGFEMYIDLPDVDDTLADCNLAWAGGYLRVDRSREGARKRVSLSVYPAGGIDGPGTLAHCTYRTTGIPDVRAFGVTTIESWLIDDPVVRLVLGDRLPDN